MTFYLSGFSFTQHSRFTEHQEKGRPLLIPLYHFHPLLKHLNISRVITSALTLGLDWNREPLASGSELLTTKLHVQKMTFMLCFRLIKIFDKSWLQCPIAIIKGIIIGKVTNLAFFNKEENIINKTLNKKVQNKLLRKPLTILFHELCDELLFTFLT